jgi:gas vesicle protein
MIGRRKPALPHGGSKMSDYRHESDEAQGQGANTLAWFLTGALIGATVAILYAPKSGKQTRMYISDKTQQGKEAVTGASQDIADSSRELFERGRKLVEDAADLFDRGRKLVKG